MADRFRTKSPLAPWERGFGGEGLIVLIVLAFLLVPLASGAQSESTESAKDHREWWIEQYGQLDEDDPLGQRAHEIFERLHKALDDRLDAGLVLLETTERLSPVALPDESIIVPKSILHLCYGIESDEGRLPKKSKHLERGDVRLGFFLAHELYHVAADDAERRAFTDSTTHSAVVGNNEDMADFYGMLTLMKAGYDPDKLFEKDRPFFREWAEWFDNGEDTAAREREVRRHMTEVRESVPYFYWGNRLIQLGRHQDGLELLDRFRTTFDSREVHSNLGYAHYQLAAERLARCEGRLVARFQLPTRIDPETLADRSRRRGGPKSSECLENRTFRNIIDEATGLLEIAANQDPDYLPARLNLAAALLLDEEPAKALQITEEARDLDPDSPEAWNASALALYLFGVQSNLSDTVEKALQQLREAYKAHPDAHYLLYNRARILDELKRTATAKEVWEEFLVAEPSGPWADVARERLGIDIRDVKPSKPSNIEDPPEPLGKPARSLRRYERRKIEGASFRGFFYSSDGISALQINDGVEVVERRLAENGSLTADFLLEPHGEPERRLAVDGGEIVFYPGYALDVRNGKVVAEIWFDPG